MECSFGWYLKWQKGVFTQELSQFPQMVGIVPFFKYTLKGSKHGY